MYYNEQMHYEIITTEQKYVVNEHKVFKCSTASFLIPFKSVIELQAIFTSVLSMSLHLCGNITLSIQEPEKCFIPSIL